MIARGGTWDTNLKVVARKTPRRAMPVPYKSRRKDPFLYMVISWAHVGINNSLA